MRFGYYGDLVAALMAHHGSFVALRSRLEGLHQEKSWAEKAPEFVSAV
ncbi:hypothetical protein [Methanocrinis sp.]